MRGFRWVVVTVAAAVAAMSVAAPSVTAKPADRKAVERQVAQALGVGYPGVVFTGVSCTLPKKAPIAQPFTCTSFVGGTTLTMDGRRTSKRDVVVEPREAVIAKSALEEFVAAEASLPAIVDCGGEVWRVVAPQSLIACRASLADGTVKQVELTVQDRAGTAKVTKVD